MQRKIFHAFICYDDDYGLPLMKTQHSESYNIRIVHEINKNKDFK